MLEAFERRTREVIGVVPKPWHQLEECTAALDDAFGSIITEVTGKALLALTVLAVKNNETVMREMDRRGSPRSVRTEHIGNSPNG